MNVGFTAGLVLTGPEKERALPERRQNVIFQTCIFFCIFTISIWFRQDKKGTGSGVRLYDIHPACWQNWNIEDFIRILSQKKCYLENDIKHKAFLGDKEMVSYH